MEDLNKMTEDSLRALTEANLMVKATLPFGLIAIWLLYFIIISPAALLYVDYKIVLKIDLVLFILYISTVVFFNSIYNKVVKQLLQKYGNK